jgi:SAM-dependent methyltransferase
MRRDETMEGEHHPDERSLAQRIRTHAKWRWDTIVVQPYRSLYHRVSPSAAERYRLESLVGPIGYWDRLRQYQISFVRGVGLEPDQKLLDIGCGPLQGGIPMIAYLDAGHYVGIDVRPRALEQAYRQVAKERLAHKNPRLVLSSDFGRQALERSHFDFVWISQLLYHLDPEQIRDCLGAVSYHLKPGGRCYGDIIGHPNTLKPGTVWSGYRFHLHTLDFMAQAAAAAGLTMQHLGQIRDHGYPEEIALCTNDILEFTKR